MIHSSTIMYPQTWVIIFALIFVNISGDAKPPEQIEDEFVKEHPEPEVESKFKIADVSLHKLESHCIFAFGEQPAPTAVNPFTMKLRNVIFNHAKVGNKLVEVIQCALANEFIRESVVQNCLYLLKEGTGDVLSFEGEKCYPKYEHYNRIDENKWNAERGQAESVIYGDLDDLGYVGDGEPNFGDYGKPTPGDHNYIPIPLIPEPRYHERYPKTQHRQTADEDCPIL